MVCSLLLSFDDAASIYNDLQGGRQVDGAISSLSALELICQSPLIREAQAGNKLTVLFDSGIRTGSDIIKAMALGAQGVLRESSSRCISAVHRRAIFTLLLKSVDP